jgi:DNA invertase Pin-like site-specific DNA recombinase
MNETSKVTRNHLQRAAYLYIRQSSLYQATYNQESTARQYRFRERAGALGWRADQIIVIDEDQGQSGESAADRSGFQRMVAEAGLGKVGIILSLEVSRLARNCADWHRLLEICALTDTLIADEDGLYDPNHFNDRLILGLRGTMSEAELHFLRARLQGGKLNKARRGELKLMLPPGFVYDAAERVVLDPDHQVQQSIRLVFDTFEREGSAWGVVRTLARQQIKLPVIMRTGPAAGETAWIAPTLSRVFRILRNPRYAGAYFYGRTRQRRGTVVKRLAQEEWKALIPNAHPGYITWDRYQANLRVLEANHLHLRKNGHPTPAREGIALLQGLVVCGRCGRRMTIRYHHVRTKTTPVYCCQLINKDRGGQLCQILPGQHIDQAVGQQVAEAMTPATIEVALEVFEELRRRHGEVDALHRARIERACQEADLAQSQFLRVNPENRLVADVLEQRWNERLRELTTAEEVYAQWKQGSVAPMDGKVREQVLNLAQDFPAVWNHPRTSPRDRKRMLRLLIEDVTLTREQGGIQVGIRWKGGAQTQMVLPPPKTAPELRRTPPEVLEAITTLTRHHADREIARILNGQGHRSGVGLSFNSESIRRVRAAHGIPSYADNLRKAGRLDSDEMIARFGLTEAILIKWRRSGQIRAVRCNKKEYLHEPPSEELLKLLPKLRRRPKLKKTLCQTPSGTGGVV